MGKLAILQMADEPQIVSTALMLRHAGYTDIKVCGTELRTALDRAGCDTVIAVSRMSALGYDNLDSSIQEASVKDMAKCDLFVEIKIRNVDKIQKAWPNLRNKIAWWRVNGAQPEICPKGGDEVNLICPVITACLWYGLPRYRVDPHKTNTQDYSAAEHRQGRPITYKEQRAWAAEARTGDNGMAYTFWPPYPKSGAYDKIDRSRLTSYTAPYCMCHSVRAWGYGPIINDCLAMHVNMYGNNSPNGQVSHSEVASIARTALALVHLKSVDCPGWALYEAILSGCPVVTGRLLNSRMLAYDLLEDDVTCFEFGVPAGLEYGRGDMAYPLCISDIKDALAQLQDKTTNMRIGEAARKRLNHLMWRADRDGASFIQFMNRHFRN